MEPFEDENPFDTGTDRLQSEASSTIGGDLSEPASPPVDGFRTGSPTPASPQSSRPPFPSPGSHRLPQPYKSEHCCARDQWLHSGEDVEILVRLRAAAVVTRILSRVWQIVDAQKTSVGSTSPYITYIIKAGVRTTTIAQEVAC